MSETRTLIGYSGRTIGREELALVPTPPATVSPCFDLHPTTLRTSKASIIFVRNVVVVSAQW